MEGLKELIGDRSFSPESVEGKARKKVHLMSLAGTNVNSPRREMRSMKAAGGCLSGALRVPDGDQ